MQRLLKFSFNTLLISGINMLIWITLGLFFGHNITQIFTITYPIQALMLVLKSVFGTGANVFKYKENAKQADDTGITIGIIFGFIICTLIITNLDYYLLFMNIADYSLKSFIIFSIMLIYLQYIFCLVLEKLYFSHQEKKSNFYTIFFNVLIFITLVFTSLLFLNEMVTIITTLLIATLFVICFFIYNSKISFKDFNIYQFIKYDSTSAFSHLLFLITYFIGLSNSFSFGEEYVLALSFFTIITDVQWDISYNVGTIAKIDISQGCFNYKTHRKNALLLSLLLNISIILLFFILYPFYTPNIYIVLIFTIPTLIDLFVVPFYELKKIYLHINYSPLKVTVIVQIANVLRTLCSFLLTPYCTLIGQEVTIYLQLIIINILFFKKYKIVGDEIIKNYIKE